MGSSKYGQLPREEGSNDNALELNQVFDRLELNAYVVDCWAGPQNSFLQIK